MDKVGVVILAGGLGTRMGGGKPERWQASPILVLENQFLYSRINFCIGEAISVLWKQFLYWGSNFCTGESISVLGNQFLY